MNRFSIVSLKKFVRKWASHLRPISSLVIARTKALLLTPLSPRWFVNRGWFICQIVFASWTIYLSKHLPVPGISVAVLGLLAVVATFERDPSSFQRAIWIFIATGLLFIEVNAIRSDRRTS